jgi:hypothetical protein
MVTFTVNVHHYLKIFHFVLIDLKSLFCYLLSCHISSGLFLNSFFHFYFLKIESKNTIQNYVAQAGLYSVSSCRSPPHAGITSMNHHAQL